MWWDLNQVLLSLKFLLYWKPEQFYVLDKRPFYFVVKLDRWIAGWMEWLRWDEWDEHLGEKLFNKMET